MSDLGPVVLGPNQPQRFYRGGKKIAAFRAGPGDGPGGQPSAPVRSLDPPGPGQDGDHEPEDWVGSTTTVSGSQTDGLTRLPDGRLLRDAINADPESYLGHEVPDAEKVDVLRGYLRRWKAEVGVFFDGVGPDSTDDQIRGIAHKHPVFRLEMAS